MVGREIGQRSGQTAHMVFVGVGAEDILQLLDPLALQVGDHQTAVVHIAAVIEHELSVALHQHAQRLPHVDEVHLEGGVLPVGRRRSGLRSCRVRHDVTAASRDDGRGVTAHEAQRKGCGQRQRSEAAHERLSGHFFFFEVFHDVFSFC